MSSTPEKTRLKDSIAYPVPRYLHSKEPEAEISPELVNNTWLAVPPKFWVNVDDFVYQNYAQEVLPLVCLEGQRIYNRARAVEHHLTQGDVKASALLYLIHPVLEALKEVHSDITYSVDLPSLNGTARCDISFYCVSSDPFYPRRCFAGLNFKSRKTIKPRELAEAMTNTDDPSNIEANSLIALSYGGDETNRTLFRGGTHTLMQELTFHANEYLTPYMAVCDWDHLFLGFFRKMRENASTLLGVDELRRGGRYMYGTLVAPEHFRVALLGYLEKAYRVAVFGDESPPETYLRQYRQPAPVNAKSPRQSCSKKQHKSLRFC
ncbi:hypothetical protein B0T19DRAFT_402566 [Cercophora scortea]|uniref:Uncharacterized protein n=1 Tax=Cercophora scortea TaxID=314031 RepID=A0AAE0M9F1_9PEZI|nr:hypothetical protein B0T19DRAFT_402566 [Cercophora scortea]